MSYSNARLVKGFADRADTLSRLPELERDLSRLQDAVAFARAIKSVTHVRDGVALYVDDISEWRTHITAAGSDARSSGRTAIVDNSELRTDEWAARLSDRRVSATVSVHLSREEALEAAMAWVASGDRVTSRIAA